MDEINCLIKNHKQIKETKKQKYIVDRLLLSWKTNEIIDWLIDWMHILHCMCVYMYVYSSDWFMVG